MSGVRGTVGAAASGGTTASTGDVASPGEAASSRDAELRPVTLDAIDKAVIRELQLDGRIPYAQLGPKVGLSQAAVRKRVQRLIDSGLMQVVAVTDPQRLGFTLQAMIGVRASGGLRSIAAELASVPEIDYVVITSGRYDLLVEVVCTDSAELLDLLDERIRGLEGVLSADVFTYLHLEKQTYSWGTR